MNKQICKNYILLSMLFLLSFSKVFPQYSESEIKVALIEKFTHFIDWPENKNGSGNQNSFVIMLYANEEMAGVFYSFAKQYKINDKPVEIKFYKEDTSNEIPDVIFIGEIDTSNLKKIIKKYEKTGTLIISNTKGFAEKGVHINLVNENKKIVFEINLSSIKKSGFSVRSRLLEYAKIIN